MNRMRAWWSSLGRRAKVAVTIGVVFAALIVIGTVGRDPKTGGTAAASPGESTASASSVALATTSATASLETTSAPTTGPTAEISPEPTPVVTPGPTPVITATPAVTPIVLKGSGTRKTKPFTMAAPATV